MVIFHSYVVPSPKNTNAALLTIMLINHQIQIKAID
jgi:hypothetical protein